MRQVKCNWCKEKGSKDSMEVEVKPTGKFNKDGSEKMIRKYFHQECYLSYLKDKEFKENELKELTELYEYLKNLHNIELLDGRMMERIQDLRNGTIKIQNRKVNKYKAGIPYSRMLQTYKYIEDKLNKVSEYKHLEKGWTEFAYFFSIMTNNITDVQATIKKQQVNEKAKETVIKKNLNEQKDLIVPQNYKKKKDELDISNFLQELF